MAKDKSEKEKENEHFANVAMWGLILLGGLYYLWTTYVRPLYTAKEVLAIEEMDALEQGSRLAENFDWTTYFNNGLRRGVKAAVQCDRTYVVLYTDDRARAYEADKVPKLATVFDLKISWFSTDTYETIPIVLPAINPRNFDLRLDDVKKTYFLSVSRTDLSFNETMNMSEKTVKQEIPTGRSVVERRLGRCQAMSREDALYTIYQTMMQPVNKAREAQRIKDAAESQRQQEIERQKQFRKF